MEIITKIQTSAPDKYEQLKQKINFNELSEVSKWTNIIDRMYLPENDELEIFLQQDGFMDKEIIPAIELSDDAKPINQKWSWDRILRSCYIKQADVLQGIYLFDDKFDLDTIRRNFDFYEPITVHESSLSPCVHTILASKLGYKEKSYELYLRTARLDLDDYNDEVNQGLHITSMAGTYLSVVEGFGGMRVYNGNIYFSPFIPTQWELYSFVVKFRGNSLKVEIDKEKISVFNRNENKLKVYIKEIEYEIDQRKSIEIYYN